MKNKIYSKYHVNTSSNGKKLRTSIDYNTKKEIIFDSLLEKKYYEDIILSGISDGSIISYELQKKYILQPSFRYKNIAIRAIEYIADFVVRYSDGTEKIIDIKGGHVDSIAKIKRKIFYYKYPNFFYEWITYTQKTGWILWEQYKKIKRNK